MNFQDIPVRYQPAYTWLWNTTITKEGIRERIDEMYENGIRAFYVLGEPENFLPKRRKTHLSPEYLSKEYIDLVYYAYEYAKSKKMYTWLYNEGGFPSGMACGKIVEAHPELRQKQIKKREIVIAKGECYAPADDSIAAFLGATRVGVGESFCEDTVITEYYQGLNEIKPIQSDNASRKNVECFIELTHEQYKRRFGDALGSDVMLMFDDESFMGTWTEGYDKLFHEKYGYDITDYIPYITADLEAVSEDQFRAMSDYVMLCGELVRDNYFIPMREWLNANGMLSTGHIDNDHTPNGIVINRYGNSMSILRAFDVPGIDVIWSQISYPDEDNDFSGMRFYPRFASSAARQQGHSDAVSESLAVYGAHVDPELTRYCVNTQAVRGISLFNFMVTSYDRCTPMMHQYRPNFIKENVGMDRLHEINDYTARLSYILSSSRADVRTALYHPARTMSASGSLGGRAQADFVRLGHELEARGISFDIADEELILSGEIKNGAISFGGVTYDAIVVPKCDLELPTVKERLAMLNGTPTSPAVERTNEMLLSRKLIFEGDDEGYLIVNAGNERVSDTVKIRTKGIPCELDLYDGEIYAMDCVQGDEYVTFNVNLLRGEAVFILVSRNGVNTKTRQKKTHVADITDFTSRLTRREIIDRERGTFNEYYTDSEIRHGFYEWDRDISGEVTYTASLPTLAEGEYLLELGEVRSTAAVYVDGESVGATTMPPYSVRFRVKKGAHKLVIVVANTPANACAATDYFDANDPLDVGPYHANMRIKEMKVGGGGLFGPVKLYALG